MFEMAEPQVALGSVEMSFVVRDFAKLLCHLCLQKDCAHAAGTCRLMCNV